MNNSSGYWDQSSINQNTNSNNVSNNSNIDASNDNNIIQNIDNSGNNNINNNNNSNSSNFYNTSSINAMATSSHHELQLQTEIPQDILIDSITSALTSDNVHFSEDGTDIHDSRDHDIDPDDMGTGVGSSNNNMTQSEQPSLEQIQRVYYAKGLEELESLQLLDLSPLANWKLSSYKQGFGLSQLRDDSPDTYWQSDGSNGNNHNNSAIMNNQLCNPHALTISFSKKVSLERISIFTNYSLDESYTPSRIKIMAGSSDGWDLSEVCTVNFNKPIGWSHIIFNGIRSDGVLKCFVVKLIILANHQDGKDSHIRAIRCFGKKSTNNNNRIAVRNKGSYGDHINHTTSFASHQSDLLKDLSIQSGLTNASGFSLNNRSSIRNISDRPAFVYAEEENEENERITNENEEQEDTESSRILHNVSDVIGFNSGFQSLELRTYSSIR
ncbi:galactose-binding domain-like protein [Scheffersomyces xylosifermentans]|uniref:galactose-binding domain-like protein n=1 Tax=Scheffersomyces xylosifermentans TaxID=1304137 RepID=UPI00315D6087